MIIVSDASPLHYLVLIGHVGVLPGLFGEIIIPSVVLGSCSTDVRQSWFENGPGTLPDGCWSATLPQST